MILGKNQKVNLDNGLDLKLTVWGTKFSSVYIPVLGTIFSLIFVLNMCFNIMIPA